MVEVKPTKHSLFSLRLISSSHFMPQRVSLTMEALYQYQSAIDCNNVGIAQWNCGEGVGAIEFLFSAYHHCFRSFSFSSTGTQNNIGDETASFSVNEAMESNLKFLGEKHEFQLANHVFHLGIRVPSSPDVVDNPSEANKTMVLNAIVFNLAVVHHLVAKWGNLDIPSALEEKLRRTAIQFYQRGLQLQQEISSCGMYTIAILNNLAQLYSTLGDVDKSAFYFSEMLSRISALEEAIMGEYDAHAAKLQEIASCAAAAA